MLLINLFNISIFYVKGFFIVCKYIAYDKIDPFCVMVI